MATLGLNTQSFDQQRAKAKKDSAADGKEIQRNLNPGAAGGEGGGVKSGAMREGLVLIRELGRGDLKRAAGSATLLLQNLGMMGLLLNPITAAVVGLGAGFFAAWKFAGALVEKLSGLKVPEFHPEYIAKHLQKINQAAEAQKEINKEVQKTVELYDSAAKTAERFTDVIKETFDHQRKMNQFAMEKELALATSEQQRQAIRKKYSDQELEINRRERDEQVKNKMKERMDLDDEAARKKKQGDAINVNSAEHDKQLLEQKKKMADEGQKYLDDLNSKGMAGKAKDALVSGFNKVALSGVSGSDLNKAEADNRAEAQRRLQAYKDQVDQNAANEEARKRKQELYKGAGDSAARAAELDKQIPDIIRMNAMKNSDEASEAAARLASENAKDQARGGRRGPDVNALQKIGAYAELDPKIEIQKKSERHLQGIYEGIQTLVARGQGGTGY
jgi:hypothetical protein